MAKSSTRRLDELKLECELLGLSPIPTRNRVNKITGDRYLDFCKDDYVKCLQSFYIKTYKDKGIYHKSLDWILGIDSPMLALQIKNKSDEQQKEIWIFPYRNHNGIRVNRYFSGYNVIAEQF